MAAINVDLIRSQPVPGGWVPCRSIRLHSCRRLSSEQDLLQIRPSFSSRLLEMIFEYSGYGETYFGFSITSDKIDYRQTSECTIEVMEKITQMLLIYCEPLIYFGMDMNGVKLGKAKRILNDADQTNQWYYV